MQLLLWHGNCDVRTATDNAAIALHMANQKEIPIYMGMARALEREDINATEVHGGNGIGGVQVETSPSFYIEESKEKTAVDYLIDKAKGEPNEITIAAIGPLTNIAVAVQKDKEFAKRVKRLVIMGRSR